MIDADALCAMPVGVSEFEWTEADFRRYAACVGGEGILDMFPTVVAWIATPTFTSLGVDPVHALHASQRIDCVAPIGGPRSVRVESRVVGVQDKGVERGAIVTTERHVLDRRGDELLAILTTTCFGRREGGCGNAGRDAAAPRQAPAREPDATFLAPTSVDLARAYSQTGDANPLHTDPVVADAAGFPRPILHGLCGLGIAGRVALDAVSSHSGRGLAFLEGRFSAPVFPGETLAIDVWRGDGGVDFRVWVPGRDCIAISAGYARLR